jgi:hypothetical protein
MTNKFILTGGVIRACSFMMTIITLYHIEAQGSNDAKENRKRKYNHGISFHDTAKDEIHYSDKS